MDDKQTAAIARYKAMAGSGEETPPKGAAAGKARPQALCRAVSQDEAGARGIRHAADDPVSGRGLRLDLAGGGPRRAEGAPGGRVRVRARAGAGGSGAGGEGVIPADRRPDRRRVSGAVLWLGVRRGSRLERGMRGIEQDGRGEGSHGHRELAGGGGMPGGIDDVMARYNTRIVGWRGGGKRCICAQSSRAGGGEYCESGGNCVRNITRRAGRWAADDWKYNEVIAARAVQRSGGAYCAIDTLVRYGADPGMMEFRDRRCPARALDRGEG